MQRSEEILFRGQSSVLIEHVAAILLSVNFFFTFISNIIAKERRASTTNDRRCSFNRRGFFG